MHMQFNLSSETLDHLAHVLELAAAHYTKKHATAKRSKDILRYGLQLQQVRELQQIFTGEALEPREKPDFDVRQDGSVFAFTALTDAALAHVREHVQLESWQWLGSQMFAVDHRLAPDLAYQLREDGFTVHVH
jgi:hypothetical protein